jgi:hypothetical protein
MLGWYKTPNTKGLERVIGALQKVGIFFFVASMAWVVALIVLLFLGVFNVANPSPWLWILAWSPLFVGAPWVICFVAGWILVGIDFWRSGTFRRMNELRKQARNRS